MNDETNYNGTYACSYTCEHVYATYFVLCDEKEKERWKFAWQTVKSVKHVPQQTTKDVIITFVHNHAQGIYSPTHIMYSLSGCGCVHNQVKWAHIKRQNEIHNNLEKHTHKKLIFSLHFALTFRKLAVPRIQLSCSYYHVCTSINADVHHWIVLRLM